MNYLHYGIYIVSVILGIFCLRYAILTLGRPNKKLVSILALIGAIAFFTLFIVDYYYPAGIENVLNLRTERS